MGKLVSMVRGNGESSHEQALGRGLFEADHVLWVRKAGSVIGGSVQDGYQRYVEIGVHGGELDDYHCSCDFFAETDLPCRHIYATLFAAEKQYPALAGKSADRPPSWRQQLAAARQPSSRPPLYSEGRSARSSQGEILYVVDRQHSSSRGLPAVFLYMRERKLNGDWGKAKPLRDSVNPAELADPRDRLLVALLQGGGRESYSYSYYSYNYAAQGLALERGLWDLAFPEMSATGRLFYRRSDSEEFDRWEPLAWDAAPPWSFVLTAALDEGGKHYLISGQLRRGDERMALDAPSLLLSEGLIFVPGHVARLDHHDSFNWISVLRKTPAIRVPVKERDTFLEELYQSRALPPREFAEDLRVEEVVVPPRPVLKIRAAKKDEWPQDRLRATLQFDYDGRLVSYGDESSASLYDPQRKRLARRDPAAEQSLVDRIRAVATREEKSWRSAVPLFQIAPRKLPQIVQALMAEGWNVEADGKLYRQPGQIDIQVTSGIDWFDLQGKVDFAGQSVALPRLLEALRKGETTVVLDDGTLGMLPDEWLRKYAPIAGMGKTEGDQIRFARSQAGFLDALLASQPQATWDEAFDRTRKAIRNFEGVAPADPPQTFQGELRPYQREGLGWFGFLRDFGFGGCLADDMGLGKTVQVLALLESRRQERKKKEARPTLVVVPRSLIFNWKQEAARFAPRLSVLDNTGTQRLRDPEKLAEHDVVLTTYGTLRNDVALLREIDFDYVVLDEAQAIKNASSESAKATRLLKGAHRLALSGTPVQNHLGELWSLFDFINPGLLGSASVFAGSALRNPEEETRQLLARALRPFILRRTKEQVAKDLPPKMEQTLYCELEKEQRKLYDELRDHYRQSLLKTVAERGMARSKIMILEALLRLRQAALHPGLIDKKRVGEASAKLDLLLPRLQEATDEGHKALVFSQFTGMLAILRKKLDEAGIVYEYLDGRTRDRQAPVERFQNDPACRLFLISLKAGGLGLNLTAADYVFLLDPWWNPAIEAQAIDRAHRIGQTQQVFACRLIARDTVEEKVLALQNTKRALADAIINADNSLIRDLGREDLELLLS